MSRMLAIKCIVKALLRTLLVQTLQIFVYHTWDHRGKSGVNLEVIVLVVKIDPCHASTSPRNYSFH
jgi:hypothetical protein